MRSDVVRRCGSELSSLVAEACGSLATEPLDGATVSASSLDDDGRGGGMKIGTARGMGAPGLDPPLPPPPFPPAAAAEALAPWALSRAMRSAIELRGCAGASPDPFEFEVEDEEIDDDELLFSIAGAGGASSLSPPAFARRLARIAANSFDAIC